MNFYRHYIGDFQRDTGHLSLAARGAYRALMDHYYATEKALPNDLDALCRMAGAVNAQERKAVQAAVGMFEVRSGALWHKRIEAELEKAGERSDTNREIALARESRKRAAKEAQKEHEAPHEESTNRAPDVPRTDHTLSTKPVTLNQEEAKKKKPPREKPMPDDFAVSERVRDWATRNGIGQRDLDQHLENFRLQAGAKGYTYTDWDAALMKAIRQNWAKVFPTTPNGHGERTRSLEEVGL